MASKKKTVGQLATAYAKKSLGAPVDRATFGTLCSRVADLEDGEELTDGAISGIERRLDQLRENITAIQGREHVTRRQIADLREELAPLLRLLKVARGA